MYSTSRSARDSIGISLTPSSISQSKVLDGSATYLHALLLYFAGYMGTSLIRKCPPP